ncbi:MAG: serine hydrolase [Cryomorphaceae bacterium]|nr:serine hydrolase [Cryomorphaceae bacterium]
MRYLLFLFLMPFAVAAQDAFYFPPNNSDDWETLSFDDVGWCEENLPALMDFHTDQSTKAFIVTIGGKIVIEQYFGNFTADSLWLWNSAGKSLTSMAIGIAEQEGLLSLDDSSADYLGEGWTSCTLEDEALITIRDQISMTSGLDDGVIDVYCTDPECLTCLAEPGTRWAYHNGPYTMLDEVIAEASGTSLNLFIYNRISQPIGMNGLFLPFGYNRVFVSKARDMARFGSLALRGGEWNGTQILNAQYAYDMVHPSQNLNPSYGYLWWLNGQSSYMLPGFQAQIPLEIVPTAPDDAYAAIGKDGQIAMVIPSLDMVVVRMGNSPDNSAVSTQFVNQMWPFIEDLFCSDIAESREKQISLYPNPASEVLNIQGKLPNEKFFVFDGFGRVVATGNESFVDVKNLPKGMYVLTIGEQATRFAVQ